MGVSNFGTLEPRKKIMTKEKKVEPAIKLDKTKAYPIAEAIALTKELSKTKFDASIEIHFRLGIDPKKGDQQIRSAVSLPHGTGKTIKIATFVSADKEKEAKDAGADFIYGEEEIKKIKDTGKIEFDIAVTTPDMMPKMAMVAKILGPRGLMPNPKTETVGTSIKEMVESLKKGKVTFKNDDTSNIHLNIGKISFDDTKLKENFETFLDALRKAKPNGVKGAYIKNLVLTSSMGPSIKIQI